MIESFNRIIPALTRIVEKLGATMPSSTGNRIADAVETIADNVGSGGGGSGGGGVFWLTETPPPEGSYYYGIAESYNEIVAAVESGKSVILRRNVSGDPPKSELQYLWQYFSYAVDDSTNVYEIGLYTGSGQYRYTADDPDAPMREIYD